MASTEQNLRREIHDEREQLADAVDTLRAELGEATNISGKLRSNLPLVTAGALGLGFVASGGIGATARLLMRRVGARHTKGGREGRPSPLRSISLR
jgi:hypothetical protein